MMHSNDMGTGLSLIEQVEEFARSGIEPRAGDYWSGRLEEWLTAVLPRGAAERYADIGADDAMCDDGPGEDETVLEWTERRRAGVQAWCFPTDELREEYLQSIARRSEGDILALLRLFLFEESCFGGDTDCLYWAIHVHKDLSKLEALPTEYRRRLLMWMVGNGKPHPGIRWALDLLPHSPQQAIDAVTGYLNAYRALRPEGRSLGLLDAVAIIRARWIENLTAGTEALYQLSPRELEVLAAALYRRLGYSVKLTPPSRDGGRDVIATRQAPGQREVIYVECKTHTSPVGVGYVRQLRGVTERHGANRGILMTIGRFTRGAREESGSRIELIDGAALIQMLNASFGSRWVEDRAWICRGLT
jgi:restriction system protein